MYRGYTSKKMEKIMGIAGIAAKTFNAVTKTAPKIVRYAEGVCVEAVTNADLKRKLDKGLITKAEFDRISAKAAQKMTTRAKSGEGEYFGYEKLKNIMSKSKALETLARWKSPEFASEIAKMSKDEFMHLAKDGMSDFTIKNIMSTMKKDGVKFSKYEELWLQHVSRPVKRHQNTGSSKSSEVYKPVKIPTNIPIEECQPYIKIFEQKETLIKELSEYCDKNFINNIRNAETPEKLAVLLKKEVLALRNKEAEYLTAGHKNNTGFNLDYYKHYYKNFKAYEKICLAAAKSRYVPATNPEVIKIEEILKKDFGAEFVNLGNDEKIAQNVLEAFKTAKKHGARLPKNISVSDDLPGHVAAETPIFGDTVFLQRNLFKLLENKEMVKAAYTTVRDEHAILHEINHLNHTHLQFNSRPLPKEMNEIRRKLTAYAATDNNIETFAELKTKKLLEGLSPEEEKLMTYLERFEMKG